MGYRQDYEKYCGIKLDDDWDVHHIDYDHNNNDIENLVALPNYLHSELHTAYNNWKSCKQNFQLSDIRLHSGLCCNHTNFMTALTDYLNVIDRCVTFMSMREFYKMRRMENE